MNNKIEKDHARETRISFVNELVANREYLLAGLDENGNMILVNRNNHCLIRIEEAKATCISTDPTVFLWFSTLTVAGDGDRYYTAGSKWGFDIKEGHPCWNNYFAKEEA